jgi:hypothetical protein
LRLWKSPCRRSGLAKHRDELLLTALSTCVGAPSAFFSIDGSGKEAGVLDARNDLHPALPPKDAAAMHSGLSVSSFATQNRAEVARLGSLTAALDVVVDAAREAARLSAASLTAAKVDRVGPRGPIRHSLDEIEAQVKRRMVMIQPAAAPSVGHESASLEDHRG